VSLLAASGKTEISKLDMTTAVKENVIRFDVTRKETLALGLANTLRWTRYVGMNFTYR
jgi:hypothetical protein